MQLLPSSPDAEKALLGLFLHFPVEVGALCAEKGVNSEWFHLPAYKTVQDELSAMWTLGTPIDAVTVLQRLSDRHLLQACGGASVVSELIDLSPSPAMASRYLEILSEKRALRDVIIATARLQSKAYNEQDDAAEIVSEFVGVANLLAGRAAPRRTRTVKELAMDKMRRMEDHAEGASYPTGISKLDRESPLTPGSMPVIAGQRKAGKSILATTIACHLITHGVRVLYFSLESPAEELIDRITANLSGVPIVRHVAKYMTEGELNGVCRAVKIIAEGPLTIRDDVYDLGPMCAAIRQEKARLPDLGVVFVDYAQLVKVASKKGENREQEVAQVSRTLRLLSMELKIALVVLSQLNEGGATRESRSLENDCTALWRVVSIEDEESARMIEIPFQRNGGSQLKFKATFQGHLARFVNFAGESD